MLGQSQQSGTTDINNCNAYAPGNTGCRIGMNNTKTISGGPQVNKVGGGVVAMERDLSQGGTGIRVWFWDNKSKPPSDVTNPGSTVNPDAWGLPGAHFPVSQCANQFGNHRIVFDITLCGDWANGTYADTPCAAEYQYCQMQVNTQGNSVRRHMLRR